MNTNQIYFDGSLGQFIRKANYELVSVNPTLEVQHGISSLVLHFGAGFKGDLQFNFSHASALGNISLEYPFIWKIELAQLNAGGLPVWKTVASAMTGPQEPGGTADTLILPIGTLELDPAEYPIGTYWMTVEFFDSVNWTRTFPFTLQII